ncbi:predicted protein [Naegleria gruberi]|uniref:Predicted protein n=1 Tax=Naegleria gruberi TaxID=5762 RepID=D2W612_NAEGR|nr:uncharacterized protein NAEGRDRAFT_76855 [Naegleria gruberi]EFC35490.1 predicted protein [Naegleria gruberi]|eukprot:XP_002668234.1 predicted protein [Naegleria gruberi strain NEG-M]
MDYLNNSNIILNDKFDLISKITIFNIITPKKDNLLLSPSSSSINNTINNNNNNISSSVQSRIKSNNEILFPTTISTSTIKQKHDNTNDIIELTHSPTLEDDKDKNELLTSQPLSSFNKQQQQDDTTSKLNLYNNNNSPSSPQNVPSTSRSDLSTATNTVTFTLSSLSNLTSTTDDISPSLSITPKSHYHHHFEPQQQEHNAIEEQHDSHHSLHSNNEHINNNELNLVILHKNELLINTNDNDMSDLMSYTSTTTSVISPYSIDTDQCYIDTEFGCGHLLITTSNSINNLNNNNNNLNNNNLNDNNNTFISGNEYEFNLITIDLEGEKIDVGGELFTFQLLNNVFTNDK